MATDSILQALSAGPETATTMPVLFIGHGSPMNAIEDSEYSRAWASVAQSLPKPKAILCVSAHWETDGSRVTAMEHPKTIHESTTPSWAGQRDFPCQRSTTTCHCSTCWERRTAGTA